MIPISNSVYFSANPSECNSETEVTFLCSTSECPEGDVILNTQIEVDAFVNSFPICDTIFGDLRLNSSVEDISGLSSIIYIQGDLDIYADSLNSLEGLNQLQTIVGRLNIDDAKQLTNISALAQLTEVGSFITIEDNSELLSIEGLEQIDTVNGKLEIYNNIKLGSLAPLSQVTHINGCLLYTSPSPRDQRGSRMPSSA